MGHFAAISAGDAGPGVTISNGDAYFMWLGNSDYRTLDTATPRIDVLAGGRAVGDAIGLVRNQGGDTRFAYRFALLPFASYDQTASMKMALGHQNPFVVAAVTGPSAGRLSGRYAALFQPLSDALVTWAVKPAEEGIAAGTIVRVWNQSAVPQRFEIEPNFPFRLGVPVRTSSIETDITPAPADPLLVRGNEIATFRVAITR